MNTGGEGGSSVQLAGAATQLENGATRAHMELQWR